MQRNKKAGELQNSSPTSHFLFILFLICRYVFDAEAHSSHLILAHTDHFDFIAQCQNILLPD